MNGSPMHPHAALVLQSLGGDPSNFVSRRVTASIAAEADLILTMTKEHRDAVLRLAPRQLRRTFTLIEAARLITDHRAHEISDLAVLRPRLEGELLDVADPIGRSEEFHAAVGTQIAGAMPPILEFCRRASFRTPN